MGTSYLALLLIFGWGRPAREPIDAAKGAPLHSRIPCDGQTAPADHVSVKATFAPGAWAREFVISRFQKDTCEVDLKIRCLHHEKEGWYDVWSAASAQPSASALVLLGSCYAWRSSEPAQYVLSGWYKDGAAGSKAAWRQAPVQQISAQPEVYEFADPKGGTARLEIARR